MEKIRVIFFLPLKYSEESEASDPMLSAYEACRINEGINVLWVKECDFESFTLTKTDFVIFEDFEGKIYENLKETKCARILGPWAVSVCLLDGKSIPNFPWPIYNVAMYGCIVTCSNLQKNVKKAIKEKVQLMGGYYTDSLLAKSTHLVTDSSKSEKYLLAAEAGVKIMRSNWIDAVWDRSQSCNIHSDDQEYEKYRCLPFQNLTVCSTGFTDIRLRKELENLVNSNGGKFTGKLMLNHTDVLVCYGEAGSSSQKYKAARNLPNIRCVDVSWVTASVEKGYALRDDLYSVKISTSTPTKSENNENPNFSLLSTISGPDMTCRSAIEETVNLTRMSVGSDFGFAKPACKRKASFKEEYGPLIENLDIKKAKRAGQYLDGCSVYITGFDQEHAEKLCKILNLSGATRYDNFSDRVTHVIVGDPQFHEVKLIKSKGYQCVLVSVHWLLESMEKELPASEEKHLLTALDYEGSEGAIDINSPLSKKGLSLLISNKTITVNEIKKDQPPQVEEEEEDNVEKDMLKRYLKRPSQAIEEDTLDQLLKGVDNSELFKQAEGSNNTQKTDISSFNPQDTSTQQTAPITQDESTLSDKIFRNLKFFVVGFEGEEFEHIKESIEAMEGTIVPKTFKGVVDYAVLPLFDEIPLRIVATEVVNEIFIADCAQERALIKDIPYYHRNLPIKDFKPLANLVITISGYAGTERSFLNLLIEALGGTAQEQLARLTAKEKGVLACSHLVCPEASGRKYKGALRWGLPVVFKEWLLECAKQGTYVSEKEFLVGDSKLVVSLSKGKIKKSVGSTVSNNTTLNMSEVKQSTSMYNPSTNIPIEVAQNTSATSNDLKQETSFKIDVKQNMVDLSEKVKLNNSLTSFNGVNTSTPVSSPKPSPWMGINTPDTPLEKLLTPNANPQLRKELEYWIRKFPDYKSPSQRRKSTPLSELKRQLWNKVLKSDEGIKIPPPDFNTSEDAGHSERMDTDTDEVPTVKTPEKDSENHFISEQLQKLEAMVSTSGGSRRQSRCFQSTLPAQGAHLDFKDSQPGTIGWDFKDEKNEVKIFMISGIADAEQRERMVRQIESLGASVSDLANYDPSCTHLLCPKPARNEKTLSCMAAGKWILHTSYLENSLEAGYFLNEEQYEFGNEKSKGRFAVQPDREIEIRMQSMHRWRKEISIRGYGAFNDMKAIVVAQKRDPIVRVIEAGGGAVVNVSPPFEEAVHATHCFIETKNSLGFPAYVPLAQQGIYVLNTVYISDYLHQPNRDIRDCVLPYFATYYERN